MKDANLRNWIWQNAKFERVNADEMPSAVSASGSVLRFRDNFFPDNTTVAKRENLTVAKRENLLAFEAGKVFLTTNKNKPLPGGGTLVTWFGGYVGGYFSVIGDMHAAKHRGEDLLWMHDQLDEHSSFGHVFRAQALQLTRPAGDALGTQQQWDSGVSEFRTRIEPLLRENPEAPCAN